MNDRPSPATWLALFAFFFAVLAFGVGRATAPADAPVHPRWHGGTARQWSHHAAYWRGLAKREDHLLTRQGHLTGKAIRLYRGCVNGTADGC